METQEIEQHIFCSLSCTVSRNTLHGKICFATKNNRNFHFHFSETINFDRNNMLRKTVALKQAELYLSLQFSLV